VTDRRTFLKLTVGALAAGIVLPSPAVAQTLATDNPPLSLPSPLEPTPEDLYAAIDQLQAAVHAVLELPPVPQTFIPELWTTRPSQTAYAQFSVEDLAWGVVLTERGHYAAFATEDLMAVQNDATLRQAYRGKLTYALDRQLFLAGLKELAADRSHPRQTRPLVVKPRQYAQLLRLPDFLPVGPSRPAYDRWDLFVGDWHGRMVYLEPAA